MAAGAKTRRALHERGAGVEFAMQRCLPGCEREQMAASHRACLVTWMFVVSRRQFHLYDETVFLAVNIVDRFLARTSVAADCFQLLALAALLIAAKMVKPAFHDADTGHRRADILARICRRVVQLLEIDRACRTCRRGSSRGCRCRCRRRGMPA